jgi:glycolate oxidase FAD binding subunit
LRRPGEPSDAVDGVRPRWVVEPDSAEALASALAAASADGFGVAPRGGGTKLRLGRTPERVDAVLSTAHLDRVVAHAHADLTATVEAGCTIAVLQQTLAERGQRLALDPPWGAVATVGGVVAVNDSGPLRTRYGSVRNLILGATVALADGTLARSGGRVVKNVAGYDLPKLVAGSLGTLGVLVEATFRLHPLPRETRDATFAFATPAGAQAFLLAVADSRLTPSCVQLRAASRAPTFVDVRFEGAGGATASQAARLEALAGEAEQVAPDPDVWAATGRLRSDTGGALVLKIGVLPAAIGGLVAELSADEWSLVVQSDGVGFARFEGEPARVLAGVREAAVYAVVYDCPREVKRGLDVWGPGQDALELMRRVKAQFDPRGTLNAGRYVGGI